MLDDSTLQASSAETTQPAHSSRIEFEKGGLGHSKLFGPFIYLRAEDASKNPQNATCRIRVLYGEHRGTERVVRRVGLENLLDLSEPMKKAIDILSGADVSQIPIDNPQQVLKNGNILEIAGLTRALYLRAENEADYKGALDSLAAVAAALVLTRRPKTERTADHEVQYFDTMRHRLELVLGGVVDAGLQEKLLKLERDFMPRFDRAALRLEEEKAAGADPRSRARAAHTARNGNSHMVLPTAALDAAANAAPCISAGTVLLQRRVPTTPFHYPAGCLARQNLPRQTGPRAEQEGPV